MQLVWVDGPLSRLDEFIQTCCVDGKEAHPARALDNMSASAGFAAPEEDGAWGQLVERLEALAGQENMPIVQAGPDAARSPEALEYLEDLERQAAALKQDVQLLQNQRDVCQKGIDSFGHFADLDVPVDELDQCEYIKIRFGHLPKSGYAMLQREYSTDPSILFVPCAEDDTSYWGVYFAPRRQVTRIDALFSELLFERIRLPGAAGTPRQVVENLQSNVDLLDAELDRLRQRQDQLWQQNKTRLAALYASACSLARLAELRKCAAVRGQHFFFCAWLRQPDLPAFEARCKALEGVNFAPDRVLSQRKWKQETGTR